MKLIAVSMIASAIFGGNATAQDCYENGCTRDGYTESYRRDHQGDGYYTRRKQDMYDRHEETLGNAYRREQYERSAPRYLDGPGGYYERQERYR